MIIKNGKVVLENSIQNVDVKFSNGRIVGIGHFDDDNDEVYDATGKFVLPGLIDKHTHGGVGYDYMDDDEKGVDEILKYQASQGVTSVVASTVSAPYEELKKTVDFVRKYKSKKHEYARLLGVHLEGPYLSVKNKGAHGENFLKKPSDNQYGFMMENADIIKDVTVSPELEGAAKCIKDLVDSGITVSGGHDDAILPDIIPAVEAGMSNLTHIFCAMSMVVMRDNVRYVGLREYGLIDDRLTAEIIADNHHMTPELVRMIVKCKGADRCCVISDSLRIAGLPEDGKLYKLGMQTEDNNQLFKASNGVAVLADGKTYAGSIQPISRMVRNLILDCNIGIVDAVKMASIVPARIVKADKDIGSIAVNKYADFCIMNEKFEVVDTFIEGRKI